MSPDIRDALQSAAATPTRAFDDASITGRAAGIRRRQRTVAAAAIGVVAIAGVALAVARPHHERVGLTGSYYPGTRTQISHEGRFQPPPGNGAEPAVLDSGQRVFLTRTPAGFGIYAATVTSGNAEREIGWCPSADAFFDPGSGDVWSLRDKSDTSSANTPLPMYGWQGDEDTGPIQIVDNGQASLRSTHRGAQPLTCSDPVYPDAPVPAAPMGSFTSAAVDGWAAYDGLLVVSSGRLLLCQERDSQAEAATATLTGCPTALAVAGQARPRNGIDAVRGRFLGLRTPTGLSRIIALPGTTEQPAPASEIFGFISSFTTTDGTLVAVVDKAEWYFGAAATREAGKDGTTPAYTYNTDPIYIRNNNAALRDYPFRVDADVWLTSTSRLPHEGRRLTPAEFRERLGAARSPSTIGFWFALDSQDRIIWIVEQAA